MTQEPTTDDVPCVINNDPYCTMKDAYFIKESDIDYCYLYRDSHIQKVVLKITTKDGKEHYAFHFGLPDANLDLLNRYPRKALATEPKPDTNHDWDFRENYTVCRKCDIVTLDTEITDKCEPKETT